VQTEAFGLCQRRATGGGPERKDRLLHEPVFHLVIEHGRANRVLVIIFPIMSRDREVVISASTIRFMRPDRGVARRCQIGFFSEERASSFSTSARSCVRPVARLLAIRSSNEIIGTSIPAMEMVFLLA